MLLKLYNPVKNIFKGFIETSSFWQDNSWLLREFKYFRRIAIIAVLASFLGAIFEGVGIGVLTAFLQNLINPHAQPFHTKLVWFDIWVLGVNDPSAVNRLYRICGLILLTTWIRVCFNYLSAVYIEFSQLLLGDRLRKQIFEQLQALPLSYFSKTRSGELINTITAEIEKIRQAFSSAAFLITRVMTILVYSISMVLISWQMTIVAILLFSLLAVSFNSLNGRVREKSFGTSIASGKFTSTAIEFINGIRTVHAFGTQNFERERYYKNSSDLVNASIKVTRAWSLVKPLTDGVAMTVLIGIIAVAYSTLVATGKLQVSSLLTFLFVLFRLVPNVQDITGIKAFLSTLHGTSENIKDLIRSDNKTYFQNGNIEFTGLKRSIDLVSVDFGYDHSNLVLHDITLTIEKGKTTALVGASGAGKTTLADLIPRFYDPLEGKVLIDGMDARQLEINSLRHKMAVVSQDTFIFNTTVWNNISYGTQGATEAEIHEAAQQANALDFILEMPEGFETHLGDRGVRLSGGQRQRIAIARALLRDPEILILDEATSALDSVSERLIQESLEKLSVGRTVIAIAHRLSTIASSDKVVVLEAGRIVEQGKYQELLERQGKLWKYHQMQH